MKDNLNKSNGFEASVYGQGFDAVVRVLSSHMNMPEEETKMQLRHTDPGRAFLTVNSIAGGNLKHSGRCNILFVAGDMDGLLYEDTQYITCDLAEKEARALGRPAKELYQAKRSPGVGCMKGTSAGIASFLPEDMTDTIVISTVSLAKRGAWAELLAPMYVREEVSIMHGGRLHECVYVRDVPYCLWSDIAADTLNISGGTRSNQLFRAVRAKLHEFDDSNILSENSQAIMDDIMHGQSSVWKLREYLESLDSDNPIRALVPEHVSLTHEIYQMGVNAMCLENPGPLESLGYGYMKHMAREELRLMSERAYTYRQGDPGISFKSPDTAYCQLVANPGLKPGEIIVPEALAHMTGKQVIVARLPLLNPDAVNAFTVVGSELYAVQLPLEYFMDANADCDGDKAFVNLMRKNVDLSMLYACSEIFRPSAYKILSNGKPTKGFMKVKKHDIAAEKYKAIGTYTPKRYAAEIDIAFERKRQGEANTAVCLDFLRKYIAGLPPVLHASVMRSLEPRIQEAIDGMKDEHESAFMRELSHGSFTGLPHYKAWNLSNYPKIPKFVEHLSGWVAPMEHAELASAKPSLRQSDDKPPAKDERTSLWRCLNMPLSLPEVDKRAMVIKWHKVVDGVTIKTVWLRGLEQMYGVELLGEGNRQLIFAGGFDVKKEVAVLLAFAKHLGLAPHLVYNPVKNRFLIGEPAEGQCLVFTKKLTVRKAFIKAYGELPRVSVRVLPGSPLAK